MPSVSGTGVGRASVSYPCAHGRPGPRSPFRAKEIKSKLGTLLQKPDSAVDLVIPYNEKPEKPAKPAKAQK